MKIRAIGTGHSFCRHPLVTPSFLVQSEKSNVLIGCGPNVPAKLETINLSIDQIDMFVLLSPRLDQVGGLEEVWCRRSDRPYLVAPQSVLAALAENPLFTPISARFSVKPTTKVTLNEEHFSETLSFTPNFHPEVSYSLFFSESEIFISGETPVVDEFLHRHAMPAQLILHSCITPAAATHLSRGAYLHQLEELPIYLQKKIWLYGYGADYLDLEEPLPMLFLPQGSCIFDSDRKDKHLEKERFIRENTKRQAGNLTFSSFCSFRLFR